ncbi:MAG TPA: hypothetical protein VFE46_16315 [Pirellulales bacterium]|nr:hypothetical protein [Pirellulales bacterium]
MAVFWALAVTVGCSDGRPTRVPVSGKVLIDGKPVTHGYVLFAPDHSRAATGALDKDGKFVLSCFDYGDGAVPGVHHVAVISLEQLSASETKWFAPKKYADPATSGLTQEITGPTDSVVINLTWDNQPGPFTERH